MLEDLHVRAIIHKLLQGFLHGFIQLFVAFFDGDALLGDAFHVTEGFKAVGLRNGIARNRRIYAAGKQKQGFTARSDGKAAVGFMRVRVHKTAVAHFDINGRIRVMNVDFQ